MAIEFDAATAGDEHSIAGQRVEIGGAPWAGIPEITDGGITTEGQTVVRGSRGQYLFVSRGVDTANDLSSKMTIGAWNTLRKKLEAEAVSQGLTGPEAYRGVIVTVVIQNVSGNNPLAPPDEEIMLLSVMDTKRERTADGSAWMMAVKWKQHALPTES